MARRLQPRRILRPRRRLPATLAATLAPLVLLGLLAGGCSRQDVEGRDIPGSVNDEADRYYDAEARELGDTEVEVRLFERTIEMPESLPEGRVTFVVTNDGEQEHGFEIEGRGMEAKLEAPLASGETGSLAVELAAGTYTVYCPVGDHRGEGMDLRLRVVR